MRLRPQLALALLVTGCTTAGSTWMAQPLSAEDEDVAPLDDAELVEESSGPAPALPPPRRPRGQLLGVKRTVIGGPARPEDNGNANARGGPSTAKLAGKVLGSFRNTYYDFPAEGEFSGDKLELKSARCKTIAEVPRGFYEAVCVQGSGTLSRGTTVSFAKRDCECAEICPRTQQKICFDELDGQKFPYGRGATGRAITPLVTVAVDSGVIPLETPIYVPEFDGLPRDPAQTSFHDGCFVAQDRGLKVKGKHIDVFTGYQAVTKMWNKLVPSNKGVTVVLDSPRCARAPLPSGESSSSEERGSRTSIKLHDGE